MAKSNIRRVPFILNLNDPTDAAIWEALEPLLTRRRASAFIRSAIAQALGITSPFTPVDQPLALPQPRTKRRVQEVPRLPAGGRIEADDGQDSDDLARATGNFLNLFG
ncbi:MAG TPA: hypothetical protein VHV83_15480 [Armatimonadota bacterium]|nr:hypothetical protein [Armatimonadota bacterium]